MRAAACGHLAVTINKTVQGTCPCTNKQARLLEVLVPVSKDLDCLTEQSGPRFGRIKVVLPAQRDGLIEVSRLSTTEDFHVLTSHATFDLVY